MFQQKGILLLIMCGLYFSYEISTKDLCNKTSKANHQNLNLYACSQDPKSKDCIELNYCLANLYSPECKGVCQDWPENPQLCQMCVNDASLPICGEFYCNASRLNEPGCQKDICSSDPKSTACKNLNYCKMYPDSIECHGVCQEGWSANTNLCSLCQSNSSHSICGKYYCLKWKTESGCQKSICSDDPKNPDCDSKDFCLRYPSTEKCFGICEEEWPENSNLCNLCQTNADLAICGENYCNENRVNEEGCQEYYCRQNPKSTNCKNPFYCLTHQYEFEICHGICKDWPNSTICDLCLINEGLIICSFIN